MTYSLGVYSVPISGLQPGADSAERDEAVTLLGQVEDELSAAEQEGWKFAGMSTATERGVLLLTIILRRGPETTDGDRANGLDLKALRELCAAGLA